jgi:hypothetical protein
MRIGARSRCRAGRVATLLLALAGLAAALGSCGADKAPTGQLGLEREDLVATVRALRGTEAPVERELAASRRAWPLVVDGLPARSLQSLRAPVRAAAATAARIPPPPLFEAHFLTGPAVQLAGLFTGYVGLSTRGWSQIGVAIDQIEAANPARAPAPAPDAIVGGVGGPSTSARLAAERKAVASFARENVDLYIESVYDGNFELAKIAEKLRKAYANLGGPRAFGATLTPVEVNALATFYSEEATRLRPHVRVRLGS